VTFKYTHVYTILEGETISLRKVLWAFAFISAFFISLSFLRLFGVLGSEFDILGRWLSIVAFTLSYLLPKIRNKSSGYSQNHLKEE